MREARGMTKDVREKMNRFMSALDALKEKFERSLNVYSGISEGVKYVGSYLMDRRHEHKAPKKKKQEKKEEAEQGEETTGE